MYIIMAIRKHYNSSIMKEYIGAGYEQVLQLNGMDSFDSIWNMDAGWFEEPNDRRGGWSGVSRLSLKKENGESIGVFLKRQENHDTKVWNHPVKGIPTFYHEFKNIRRFTAHGIPTLEPVYFACRYQEGKSQAILITRELEGFQSLDAAIYERDGAIMQNRAQREEIMDAVAKAVRKMHGYHFQHRCLYGKHIFLGLVDGCWEVKFIDLEKVRRILIKKMAIMCDLDTLPRHLPRWGCRDRVKFLKIYMQEEKLSRKSKLIWRGINRRMLRRNKMIF